MSILDIAKQRFSVRSYLDKEISQETLETILEAVHVAPTAANMQPVKLLVVKSDEAKAKLAKQLTFIMLQLQSLCVQIRVQHGRASLME
jgi:nitroreductase